MREIAAISLLNAQVTATATAADVDLAKYYVTPGKREAMATLNVLNATGVATDTGTITCKLQTSATTVDTDFSDLTNGAFTVVADTDIPTTAGAQQTIHFAMPNDRYVRVVSTVGTNPILDVAVTLFLVKRSA